MAVGYRPGGEKPIQVNINPEILGPEEHDDSGVDHIGVIHVQLQPRQVHGVPDLGNQAAGCGDPALMDVGPRPAGTGLTADVEPPGTGQAAELRNGVLCEDRPRHHRSGAGESRAGAGSWETRSLALSFLERMGGRSSDCVIWVTPE